MHLSRWSRLAGTVSLVALGCSGGGAAALNNNAPASRADPAAKAGVSSAPAWSVAPASAATPAGAPVSSAAPLPSGAASRSVAAANSPGLMRLLLNKRLLDLAECGHDVSVAGTRCGFSKAGEAQPVADKDTLRLFVTEPPGMVAVAADWHPARKLDDDNMVFAECEFEPLGELAAPTLGPHAGVAGWFYGGTVPVVRVSACAFGLAAAPQRLNAAHLLVAHKDGQRVSSKITRTRAEALTIAQRAKAEIQGGLPFSQAVSRYSDEPGSKKRQGQLGNFTPTVMVLSFSFVVLSTPIGETSPAFETPFGFHILERNAAK